MHIRNNEIQLRYGGAPRLQEKKNIYLRTIVSNVIDR